MAFEDMTPYEQKAWQQSIKVLYASPRRKVIPAKVRSGATKAATKVSEKAADLPGAEAMQEIVEKAFDGTLALTFQPALRSARPNAVVKRYTKKHPHVQTHEHVRALPLEHRDAMVPPKFGYAAVSAGQGAATSLAITGAVVSTTVSGGTTAAVAIGAIAADSVASMAMMGRTIGAVATRYGYDVRHPDEELFAMGVLSLGIAGSMGAKTQALGTLSRLTQQMMRQATWKQLNENVLVRAIAQVYKLLGLRLTHKKLAQTVPVVGVGINAALTAQLTEQTFRRAQAVYRLRALSETYGIDPQEWMNDSPTMSPATDDTADEPVVDVLEVLDAELAQDPDDDDGARTPELVGEAWLHWDAVDLQVSSDSRRTARYRLLQSWYREEVLHLPRYGSAQSSPRKVGSMLHEADVRTDPGLNPMPEAAAYASTRVKEVHASGGSAEEYRLRHNMLSSMPLCFSLFGTLRALPDRGLELVQTAFDPDASEVEWIECEWKPASDPLGDRTAFDAALLIRCRDDTRHLIGVETKYTEPFSGKEYLTDRYRSVHEASGWFSDNAIKELAHKDSNQLWRNTLLAACCEEDYDRASVVVLALADDPGVKKALPRLESALVEDEKDRCRFVPLEDLIDAMTTGLAPGPEWADRFRARYLDLTPVTGVPLLGGGVA